MAIVDLASVAAQRLSTQWPFVLATLLALLGAWLLHPLLKSNPLSTIPLIGEEMGDDNKRRAAFMHNAMSFYNTGYAKVKKGLGIFRITTARESTVVVVDQRYLPELKNLPDDVLSFARAIDETMHPEFTNTRADRPIIPYIVKKDLTPALHRLNPTIAEEVDLAFQTEFPDCKDFTAVPLNHHLLRIVSQVSGRIFVGPELCRTEEYTDMAINFTVLLMTAANSINAVKSAERAAKAPGLPQVKELKIREEKGRAFLKPLIEARKKAMKEDHDYQKPDDIMQWILDDGQSNYGEQKDEELVQIQLALTFAAIHTTTLTATNAFYTLASLPELIPELRDEIQSVLKEYGTFTTAALQKMKKLDSFLREVMRTHPLGFPSFSRKVLKPITLSSGQKIPAGCILEVPAYSIMNDPEQIHNPTQFDPWRSYRLREGEDLKGVSKASASSANQLVTVSPTALNFGYGRHACPGRFFAANEIKMIMGRAILDFDFKHMDGSRERPANMPFAESYSPDPTRQLLFKRVAV